MIWGLVVAALGPGCGKSSPPKAKRKPPLVRVVSVKQQPLTESIDLTGTVEPTRTARMASPTQGPVLRCLVREGDVVKRRQLLVRIGRQRGQVAQAASAAEALQKEQRELTRVKSLVAAGALPGAELDQAKARVSSARALLASAAESTGDAQIHAPWRGLVSKVYVAVGHVVAPMTPLVDVFDPTSLVVRFAVPERFSTRVKAGGAVRATLDAWPGRRLQGRIVRVYPELDRSTRFRTVEAVLDTKDQLVPGMFVRLQVVLREIEKAIVVPTEALVVTPKGERMVFVVRGGRAHRVAVTLGSSQQGIVRVLAGLKVGQAVVVAGNEKLKHGGLVRIDRGRAGGGSTAAAGKERGR